MGINFPNLVSNNYQFFLLLFLTHTSQMHITQENPSFLYYKYENTIYFHATIACEENTSCIFSNPTHGHYKIINFLNFLLHSFINTTRIYTLLQNQHAQDLQLVTFTQTSFLYLNITFEFLLNTLLHHSTHTFKTAKFVAEFAKTPTPASMARTLERIWDDGFIFISESRLLQQTKCDIHRCIGL